MVLHLLPGNRIAKLVIDEERSAQDGPSAKGKVRVARSSKPRSPRSPSPKADDQRPEDTEPQGDAPLTAAAGDDAVALPEPDETSPERDTPPLTGPKTPDQDADTDSTDAVAAPQAGADQDVPDLSQGAGTPETSPEAMPEIVLPETPETDAESAHEVPAEPVEHPRIARGPGFFTLLLGGVIAGGIGFAVSEYDLLNRGGDDQTALLAQQLSEQSGQIEDLTARAAEAAEAAAQASALASTAAQPDDIATLRDTIANLPTPSAPGVPDPALADRLDAVELRLEDLTAQIAALPVGAAPEAVVAMQTRLAALQAELEDQRAAVADATAAASDATAAASDARSSATEETRRITVQAALAQISAALENGAPFVDATATLQNAGGVTVPAGLQDNAAEGVATLAALQRDFPLAARDALNLSIRETSGGGVVDRFGAFLRAQTGARSLDARDGDDPDAVLSRAEAALKTEDIEQALTELAALPASGQAAMANWAARAEARLAAVSALADLNAATNSK